MGVAEIPEVVALEARDGIVRIAAEVDVPFSARVRRIVDAPEFRRLAHVTQLGLVGLVYPGATHSRFEHALGVYQLMLRFLRQLCRDERFATSVTAHDAETAIVAALLHDLGHWPFCHAIEDLHLADVPRHEELAERFLDTSGGLAAVLREEWGVSAQEVLELIAGPRDTIATEAPQRRLLRSLLSGPIDVDKMDYLQRDSLHAGVPYGRHFDQGRLIGSLVLNRSGDGLALSEKGKTAAELMVFARYVMFSEVYWHHAVRAATAMLGRAFYELRGQLALDTLFRESEQGMIDAMQRAAENTCWHELLEGIFGSRRRLYKRVGQFSSFEGPETYRRLAGRPYPWLVECAREFSKVAASKTHVSVGAHEVLIDAPPIHKEVELAVDIFFRKEGVYRPLAEVSPVVEALAQKQFDDYVKRVRVYCHPRVSERLHDRDAVGEMLEEAIARVGDSGEHATAGGPHRRVVEVLDKKGTG